MANNPQTILKWTLNRPYHTTFLDGLAEMSGCSRTSTDQRKMLGPKEIEQSNLIVEEVVKVLEETFLNPFMDDLDKNQFCGIVSCKTVSIEIKDSLITIDEQEQEMMLEYIQRMNKDNVTDSWTMDVIRKSKIKYFSSSTFRLNYRKKGKQEKLKCKETY